MTATQCGVFLPLKPIGIAAAEGYIPLRNPKICEREITVTRVPGLNWITLGAVIVLLSVILPHASARAADPLPGPAPADGAKASPSELAAPTAIKLPDSYTSKVKATFKDCGKPGKPLPCAMELTIMDSDLQYVLDALSTAMKKKGNSPINWSNIFNNHDGYVQDNGDSSSGPHCKHLTVVDRKDDFSGETTVKVCRKPGGVLAID
jgi:hypothetical protein